MCHNIESLFVVSGMPRVGGKVVAVALSWGRRNFLWLSWEKPIQDASVLCLEPTNFGLHFINARDRGIDVIDKSIDILIRPKLGVAETQ